jgi:drug/metabolite transporter (DMT)-like permease
MKKIGAILLILGVILMLIVGYNFYTEKSVAGLEPRQPYEEVSHPFPWYPVIGAVLVAGGIILMATSKRRKLNM